MGDYANMRTYLESLSGERFGRIMSALGTGIVEIDGQVLEILLDDPGGEALLGPNWRKERTETMLDWKETNKAQWNRLCSVTKVESDQDASNRRSRWSLCIAWIALAIASISLFSQAYETINHPERGDSEAIGKEETSLWGHQANEIDSQQLMNRASSR